MPRGGRRLAVASGGFALVLLPVLLLVLVDTPAKDAGREAGAPADAVAEAAAGPSPEPVSDQTVADGSDRTADGAPRTTESPGADDTVLVGPRPGLAVRARRWPDGAGIAGARVTVVDGRHETVASGRTGTFGRSRCELGAATRGVTVVVEADGYAEPFEQLVEPGDDELLTVIAWLVPSAGWIGRVVTPFGEGVAGARVVAHRHWPLRPSLLHDTDRDMLVLATLEAAGRASVTSTTNAGGYYYVEPFPDVNVVDLHVAAVGSPFASARLRVPLPLPDPYLPDLVQRPSALLTGRVVDARDRPLRDVRVEIALGPGAEARADGSAETGRDGRFALARHLSAARLRVSRPGFWMTSVRAGDEVLAAMDPLAVLGPSEPRDARGATGSGRRGRTGRPALDPADEVEDAVWVDVGPEVAGLAVRMERGGVVSGRLLDAGTDEPVVDARCTLSVLALGDDDWTTLGAVRTDEMGSYRLLVPPWHLGRMLVLAVESATHEDREIEVGASRDEPLPEERPIDHLVPRPGVWEIDGAVDEPGSVGAWKGAVVRLYEAPGPGPSGPAGEEGVPDDARLTGEVEAGDAGLFTIRTTARPDDRLLLVAAKGQGVASAGPVPARQVMSSELLPVLAPRRREFVVRLPDDRPRSTSQLRWTHTHPLRPAPVTGLEAVGHELASSRSLLLYPSGMLHATLELDRGPIAAPIARLPDWVDLASWPEGEPIVLEPARRLHEVSGRVVFHRPGDWPDTCLAFGGDPVSSLRRDRLGEDDWCVRPDAEGRYRLELPAGTYTSMLYRPLDDDGIPSGRRGVIHDRGRIEVLARREVTVRSRAYGLDTWSAGITSGRRMVVPAGGTVPLEP